MPATTADGNTPAVARPDYYAWWKNDTAHLHILPQDWNSPVPVGSPLTMRVYSAASTVELKVSVGKTTHSPCPPKRV